MLLGLQGASAIGKTFFIDKWIRASSFSKSSRGRLIVVSADDARMKWIDNNGILCEKKVDSHACKPYKEHVHVKLQHIDMMMWDDEHLYVVESSKYFSGPQKHIAECATKHNGGVYILLLTVTDEFLIMMLSQRRQSLGRTMDKYDSGTIHYEASVRVTNMAHKQFDKLGIPYELLHLRDRSDFQTLVSPVLDAFLEDDSLWHCQ